MLLSETDRHIRGCKGAYRISGITDMLNSVVSKWLWVGKWQLENTMCSTSCSLIKRNHHREEQLLLAIHFIWKSGHKKAKWMQQSNPKYVEWVRMRSVTSRDLERQRSYAIWAILPQNDKFTALVSRLLFTEWPWNK